jgi:hypothetical protein
MRPDHEVDLALAIEAMLLHRADGDDLHNSVLALLQWAVNVPDGGLPTAGSTIPEDNLRLPFVASQLTVVIWETVRRNLRAVIQHELQRYRPDDPPAPATPPPSPAPPPPPTAAGADGTAPNETPLEPPAHGQAQSNPATTNAWQSAVGLIRDRLFREISARNLSKDTPEVAARIAELEADLARLNELSGDVSLGRLASVVDELEALGRRILGGFWPNPPRPA